jgi:hypothetical protein
LSRSNICIVFLIACERNQAKGAIGQAARRRSTGARP